MQKNKATRPYLPYFLGISLLIIVILFAGFSAFSYTSLKQLAKDMLVDGGKKTATTASDLIKKKQGVLVSISDAGIVSDDEISIEDKLKLITSSVDLTEFEDIFIIDKKGNVYPEIDITEPVSNRTFFKSLQNKESVISEITYNSPQRRTVPFIAVPVANKGKGGEVLAVAATVKNDMLLSLVINKSVSNDGYCVIAADNGEILAGSSGVTNEKTIDIVYPGLSTFLKEGIYVNSEDYGVKFYDEDNKEKIAIFIPIQDTNWFLISSAKKEVAYAPMNRLALSAFVLMILTLTFMLSVLTVLMLRFKKLGERMQEEAKKSLLAINLANLFILEVTKAGIIVSANENFYNTTGYDADDIVNKKFVNFLSKNDVKVFKSHLDKINLGGVISEIDLSVKKKNGGIIYLIWDAYCSEPSNDNANLEFIGTNITNLKEYQNKIHKLAYFDELTDRPNRFSLEDTVNSFFKRDVQFALMLINIDNFKMINDAHGLSFGNKYIKHVCDSISELVDDEQLLFKLTGDEYAVVYTNYFDYGDLGEYAAILFNSTAKEYVIDDIVLKTTCSIGISIAHEHGVDFDSLYKSADIALTKAKTSGKARITFFAQRMNEELLAMLSLDRDLKLAIENEEFVLYYQPQYDFDTGKIYGFEALIRWVSPTRGFVSPGVFIGAAEKSRLIVPIGIWALKESANFAKEVVALGYEDICISVNVSVIQLSEEDFVKSVLDTLAETGVNFKNIKIEITESVMMESIEVNLAKIRELVDAGIKIALDDFGTGYSSLTYLKRIPIQLLKIDKSFVDTILDDNENKEIITSIIDLAHNIKIKVVAEGVEEKTQLLWLKQRGCNICQGYYSGKPVPREKAIEQLSVNIYDIS